MRSGSLMIRIHSVNVFFGKQHTLVILSCIYGHYRTDGDFHPHGIAAKTRIKKQVIIIYGEPLNGARRDIQHDLSIFNKAGRNNNPLKLGIHQYMRR